ncbi:MAG: hypothetical protein HQ488_03355 [Parcubacteria group bacterium]|nr:hypothetical protein [Parcubacteria group bacterium]
MPETSTPHKKIRKILIILIVVFLFGAVAFAGYSVTGPDVGPDIEEGDIVSDLPSITGVPTSGRWSFKLDIGNLGSAYIYSDPDSQYVVLEADGQRLFFNNLSGMVPYFYRTTPRTQGGATAYFEFTAVDSDVIDGSVYHSSAGGGGGVQSFHMELIEAELLDNERQDLSNGTYAMTYDDVESDCEDGAADFPGLPSSMDMDVEHDFDTGDPSGDIYVEMGNDSLLFQSNENPNIYSQTSGSTEVGIPLDNDGDIMLDYEYDTFNADYEFYGTGENLVEGYVTITGSNGCSYTASFSAIH